MELRRERNLNLPEDRFKDRAITKRQDQLEDQYQDQSEDQIDIGAIARRTIINTEINR